MLLPTCHAVKVRESPMEESAFHRLTQCGGFRYFLYVEGVRHFDGGFTSRGYTTQKEANMKAAVMLSAMFLFVLSFAACELDEDTDPASFSRDDTIDMGPGARNIAVTITNHLYGTIPMECYVLPDSGGNVAFKTEYKFGSRQVLDVPVAFRVRENEADWEELFFLFYTIGKGKVYRRVVYADNPSASFDL
jgi:hypothetical protein